MRRISTIELNIYLGLKHSSLDDVDELSSLRKSPSKEPSPCRPSDRKLNTSSFAKKAKKTLTDQQNKYPLNAHLYSHEIANLKIPEKVSQIDYFYRKRLNECQAENIHVSIHIIYSFSTQ